MSLEAAYPFVRPGPGLELRYHAAPNVYLVMKALNLVKGCYPIVGLPLLAVILRADLRTQQPQVAWAFNALCNTASLFRALRPSFHGKAAQFEDWEAMETSSQVACLEAMRTAAMPEQCRSSLGSPSALFQVGRDNASTARHEYWDQRYSTLQRIARAYGLDNDEFDFYLSVPTIRPGKRVFYPFHVLSRPLAESLRWDWHSLHSLSTRMLTRMRKNCNRHAEAAGLGEPHVDETRFIYWMVAHFSQVVKSLKADLPAASRDEVRFRILDRWGLPIVPWIRTMLTASLCKGPDHGIAMRLGITEPEGPERFDPVKHIDLDKCTVTIDTVSTNMAMWNYNAESWPMIRDVLASVPLRHPLWRIHDAAGEDIWTLSSARSSSRPAAPIDPVGTVAPVSPGALVTPIAPVPDFDMPLLPIEAWFTDAPIRPRCDQCNADFNNVGSLIQHCRTEHSTVPVAPEATDPPRQLEDDVAYWQERLECSVLGCGKSFGRHADLERHMRMHNSDKRFKCDQCEYSTVDQGHLAVHKRTHTPDDRFACDEPGCDYVAVDTRMLAAHKNKHTGDKPWVCTWEGCDKAFAGQSAMIQHRKSHTGQAVFVCEICGASLTHAGNLRRHKNRKHPGWREAEADGEEEDEAAA